MADKKLVIFDFDGVLADTLLMCYGIHKEMDKDFSYDEYKDMSKGNFHTALDKSKNIVHPDFQKIYDDKICDIRVPPVIKDAVIELSARYRLFIVSSGLTSAMKKYLESEGVVQYFEEIQGYDVHKSKAVKLGNLLKANLTLPKDAVMITDSLGDVLEAHEVSILSIAVCWGLHNRLTLAEGNPAAIIEDPKDLIPAIERILG